MVNDINDALMATLTEDEIEACRKKAAAAIIAGSKQDLTATAMQVLHGRRDQHWRMREVVKGYVREKIMNTAKESANA